VIASGLCSSSKSVVLVVVVLLLLTSFNLYILPGMLLIAELPFSLRLSCAEPGVARIEELNWTDVE
jgi:hypothetical protein